MNHFLGILIESTVAILLVVTIGYCVILNNRLQRLRADEGALRATIGELITATEIAERAIAGLKVTVRECDQNLGERLNAAERYCADLDAQLAAGDTLLRRITQIAAAARPNQAPPAAPNSQSTLAAAQAFLERARSRSGEIAA